MTTVTFHNVVKIVTDIDVKSGRYNKRQFRAINNKGEILDISLFADNPHLLEVKDVMATELIFE